ncbi:MAG TPA: Rne/Rng family ribonuclease [Roseiarcus sp.]|jgi:ribonuclease E
MANKMIIDASHPEETRVVVLRGNRVEEFDFESASKRPLRGNIYLAKVTRVEPSLQAAFIDYGGNRHGFLAFSEIHPDYYQIPVADRQALLEEEALSQREEDEDANGERRSRRHRRPRRAEIEARADGLETVSGPAFVGEFGEGESVRTPPSANSEDVAFDIEPGIAESSPAAASEETDPVEAVDPRADEPVEDRNDEAPADGAESSDSAVAKAAPGAPFAAVTATEHFDAAAPRDPERQEHALDEDAHEVTTLEGGSEERVSDKQRAEEDGESVEQIGGDAMEEIPRRPQRLRRQYKIQEVIKRRQVLLVQVVKEERGNKGAALTTYLSLAGRYSVLMPNTARGGGISRKITNAQDRGRLKAIAEELDVPEGMGVILRTAGASRTKPEVKRDFEYLLRMWETVRETTLASSAPTLVYEEGSLIKRAIRDLYSKEVEEIVVAGETGYREAREFMRLLMPSHVNTVQLYRETAPVFAKAGVESQLDAMFSNQVTLKSGGYIVINQTEALVAIDVNSGRSTREHNIEDTALRTNVEAADEIARQLRLRDLAGLIVVDFIDMEESRNNRSVERRIKDALKNDRARIQVGRISHFGLLEMSRQRIRTGVLEGSTVVCAHCQGAGVVRSTASIALHVLRVLEDALIKSSTHDLIVRARTPVALYILNQKRINLRDLERRFGVMIVVEADDALTGANYHAIERGEPATGVKSEAEPVNAPAEDIAPIIEEAAMVEADDEEALEGPGEENEEAARESDRGASQEDADAGRRRRRRRRRRGGERSHGDSVSQDAPQPTDDGLAVVAEIGGDLVAPSSEGDAFDRRSPRSEEEHRRRPRGSRGERSRFRRRDGEGAPETGGPGFDSPPSLALEEGFAASEADYSPAPPAGDTVSHEGTLAEPAPVAAEREAEAGDVAPSGARAEPNLEPPAPAEAEPARAETPESPPAAEPPRPRRSGWWQRARATVIGS